jgi:hypothetical protein
VARRFHLIQTNIHWLYSLIFTCTDLYWVVLDYHEEHEEKRHLISGFVTFVFFVVNPHSNSVARTGRGRISPVALKLV